MARLALALLSALLLALVCGCETSEINYHDKPAGIKAMGYGDGKGDSVTSTGGLSGEAKKETK